MGIYTENSTNPERRQKQVDLLNRFFSGSTEEWLRDRLEVTKGSAADDRGLIFEEVALASLSPDRYQYPELSRFIIQTLQNPTLVGLRPEPDFGGVQQELSNYQRWLEADRTDMRKMPNPDALLISPPDHSGGPYMVTGIVEAKSKVPTKRSGTRVRRQHRVTPYFIYQRVKKLGPVFPQIIQDLGLGGEFPDRIDCEPVDRLTKTILVPENQGIARRYHGWEIETVPFTEEEIDVIVDILRKRLTGN